MRHVPRAADLAPGQRPRWRRPALTTAGVLAAGVVAVACGGSPSSPGTAGSSASVAAPTSGLLAFSSCMRSHGVASFPDPAASGGIPKETLQQLGVSASQFNAADSACRHLIPAGESLSGQVSQSITVRQEQDYLRAVACMRSHGITNFPEPVFQSGKVEFPQLQHLVDINSPQFTQAYKTCQKLIPPGLPYSGSAG